MTELSDRVDQIVAAKQQLMAVELEEPDAPAIAFIYGNTVMLLVPGPPDGVLNEVNVTFQVFHVGEPASTLKVHTLKR